MYLNTKPLLKRGSSHSDVAEIQRLLSQKLRPIPITGRFDDETEIAVKSFQSRMFLKPDGVVGSLTWQALYTNAPVGMPTLSQGAHGAAVITIQELLSIDRYYCGDVDGDFGPQTRLAVQRFQTDYRLPTSGVVDAATWRVLSEI